MSLCRLAQQESSMNSRADLEHSVLSWQVAHSVCSTDCCLCALASKVHVHVIMRPQKTFELRSEVCLNFCWTGAWPFFPSSVFSESSKLTAVVPPPPPPTKLLLSHALFPRCSSSPCPRLLEPTARDSGRHFGCALNTANVGHSRLFFILCVCASPTTGWLCS